MQFRSPLQHVIWTVLCINLYFYTTGTIYVEKSLPAGEHVFRLVIDAQDGGGQRAVQQAEVYISVTGPGSNPPIFDQRVYRFTVSEDISTSAFVGTVRATYAGSPEGTSSIQFIILLFIFSYHVAYAISTQGNNCPCKPNMEK